MKIETYTKWLQTLCVWSLFFAVGFMGVGPVFGDQFHLETGVVIEGELIEEDAEHYIIRIPVGTTRVIKSQVTEWIRIETTLSPEARYAKLKEEAQTVTDWETVAAMARELKHPWEEWRSLQAALKVAETAEQELDPALLQRMQKLEAEQIMKAIIQAEEHMAGKRYRQAAFVLMRAADRFAGSDRLHELRPLKKEALAGVEAEDETLQKLESLLVELPFYPIDSYKNLQPGAMGAWKAFQLGADTLENFQQAANGMHPAYGRVVRDIYQVYHIKLEHQQNDVDSLAFTPLHSVEELSQLRVNKTAFNQARTRNNHIYQARGACQQYNQFLQSARNHLEEIKEQQALEKEANIAAGYEWIHGEWLKGEDAFIAKGWVKVYHTFLDPKDPDFEKNKAFLEREEQRKEAELQVKPSAEAESPEVAPYDVKELAALEDKLSKEFSAQFPEGDFKDSELEALKSKFAENEKEELSLVEARKLTWPLGIVLLVVIYFVIKMARVFIDQLSNWLSGFGG